MTSRLEKRCETAIIVRGKISQKCGHFGSKQQCGKQISTNEPKYKEVSNLGSRNNFINHTFWFADMSVQSVIFTVYFVLYLMHRILYLVYSIFHWILSIL